MSAVGRRGRGRDDGRGSVDPFRQSFLVVMTTGSHLQYFKSSSTSKGRKEGKKEEWKEGRKDGWKEGRKQGRKSGRKEGKTGGRKEGMKQG